MSVQRIQDYLAAAGIQYEKTVHERTYTAQQTAAVTHVKGRELAKTVILALDGDFIMAVIPASKRINLSYAREAIGAEQLRLADESEFSRLFPGCELGAMPPFGKLFGMDLWVGESLKSDDWISFHAGTHTESLRMKFADFDKLESPRFAKLTSD